MPKSKSNKEKAKHKFTPQEAAGYLRQLADNLESGAVTLHPENMELESEVKVKEERKSKGGHTNIKIKLKFEKLDTSEPHQAEEAGDQEPPAGQPDAAAEAASEETGSAGSGSGPAEADGDSPEEAPEPDAEKAGKSKASYKRLKKDMARDFTKLGKLNDGEDPAELARLVDSFAEQGRKMCTYPGKKFGEEYYEAFLAELGRMEEAARVGDLEGLQAALKALAKAKKVCHDKYK